MRHLMTFQHHADDETNPWDYQVMYLDTLDRVQLWYRPSETGQWEMGHGKDVPMGSTPENVANLMRLFIQGEMTHETYNELLPR